MRDGLGNANTGLIPQDATIQSVVGAYLDTLEDGIERRASGANLATAFQCEPLARGCPTLAMLAVEDLAACRRQLEALPGGGLDVAATLRAFILWSGSSGAHTLPPAAVTLALAGSRGAAPAR